MNAPIYMPGGFCDVAPWIDGRLLLVSSDGPLVRCWLEPVKPKDAPIWQQTAPESLLFCRGAVQGNLMLTVHQGHDSGQAWLVGSGLAQSQWPTFGVQPVGIDSNNAYVVWSGDHYNRKGLVSQPYPSGAPGSSQGLSDVQPDGTLWWADQHRTLQVNGATFTFPNQRRAVNGPLVIVGQVDGGIAAGCNGKNTLVIPGAECFEPHVAVSPTGRVAICARTPKGAAYVTTTIQELSA